METEGIRRLRRWMVKKGLDQRGLAAVLGVSQTTVCRWLAGTQKLDLEPALRIQQVTGIPPRAWLA